MSEEKVLGEMEETTENQIDQEKKVSREKSLEKSEISLEKNEIKTEEKIKKAEKRIVTSGSSVQKDDTKMENHINDVADLEAIEDQIQKLVEIATQDSPKMALKVARALNSNYVLDQMHDQLINEEELRSILIKKGFVENI